MADLDLSNAQSGCVVVTTSADVSVALNQRRIYEIYNNGFDSGAVARSTAVVFGSSVAGAVDADYSQAADKFFINATAVSFGLPTRIAGVSEIRMKAGTANTTVTITAVIP